MALWDLYKGRDYHIEPTLERIEKAAAYIGNPQKGFPAVLVGGTNGKGSTCAFLERIFRDHGLKTGWFVSPHLIDERERWRINGRLIEEDVLSWYVRDLKEVFERFDLTYFEAATLIAVAYFGDMGVDVAVVEVGMGGRWDATKVCEPAVIGITNVGRDHTKWLGDSVDKIAEDKLHLYREGIPMVLGSAKYPLYPIAVSRGISDLVVAGYDYTYHGSIREGRYVLESYTYKDLHLEDAPLGLLGKWQIDNAAMAITLAREFMDLDAGIIRESLSKTRWEGRMEILREDPILVVDGSHNPDAIGRVVKELRNSFRGMEILFTGLVGKDWELSMEVIRRYTDVIYLVQIQHYRGEPVNNLYRKAKDLKFRRIEVLNSAEDILLLEVPVCALGSLYLVGEIKKAVEKVVL